MTQTAISLSDLQHLAAQGHPHPLLWLLRPFLTKEQVEIEKGKFDGFALMVNTEVEGLDWEAAKEIALRRKLPERGHFLRIYERRAGRWVKAKVGATEDEDDGR